MRRFAMFSLSGLAACLLLSPAVLAGGHKASDFPLRVHIFEHNSHSHYSHRMLDYVDGEGRANLYENGVPRGFEYGYRCMERLRNSDGYETFMARWKKPGKTLEILQPVFGKPDAAETCELSVEMKETAYYKKGGALGEESPEIFKEWMVKHEYDPEHGKNEPVSPAPGAAGASK